MQNYRKPDCTQPSLLNCRDHELSVAACRTADRVALWSALAEVRDRLIVGKAAESRDGGLRTGP